MDGKEQIEELQNLEKISSEVLIDVLSLLGKIPNKETMSTVIIILMTTLIGIIRGLKGDEYLQGFLKAAIEDKTNIVVVEEIPTTIQ